MFVPRPLANSDLRFPDELMAFASDTEIDYVRADETSVRFPYSSALRHSLVRLESISTASIAGPTPDLHLIIWMLMLDVIDPDRKPRFGACPFPCSEDVFQATSVAFRYEKILERIVHLPAGQPMTEHDLLMVHSYLSHDSMQQADMRYRATQFSTKKDDGGSIGITYCPPSPQAVPVLMKDLVEYISTPRHTPTIQAAIAHFQLQAICPFKTSMDSTERAVAQAILHQRRFSRHLIPTIGFPLANDYDAYVRALMPYRHQNGGGAFDLQKALEDWIRCCLDDTKKSTAVVRSYMESLRKIVDSYRARIGSYKKGSAVDVLISELPGYPIINTKAVMTLTGKGYTASSEAIAMLAERGVLSQLGNSKRNRLFEAREIIDAEQQILDNFLPKKRNRANWQNF